MDEFEENIRAEMENVERVLAELGKAKKSAHKELVALVGMGAYIQNIYGGMENILKQLLLAKKKPLPRTSSWHRDLLSASVKYGFITKKTAVDVGKLMTFRHFFTHSYGFLLDKAKLGTLVDSAPAAYFDFKREVEKAIAKIKDDKTRG